MEAQIKNLVKDPPSSPLTWTENFQFMWKFEKFSRLNTDNHYSDSFTVGGYKWRVLIYPKGDKVDHHLSVFLQVADSASLPNGWSRDAKFSLAVISQVDKKQTIKREAKEQFNAQESSWGYSSFMHLSDLYDRNKGYLVNDTLVVEVEAESRFGLPAVAITGDGDDDKNDIKPKRDDKNDIKPERNGRSATSCIAAYFKAPKLADISDSEMTILLKMHQGYRRKLVDRLLELTPNDQLVESVKDVINPMLNMLAYSGLGFRDFYDAVVDYLRKLEGATALQALEEERRALSPAVHALEEVQAVLASTKAGLDAHVASMKSQIEVAQVAVNNALATIEKTAQGGDEALRVAREHLESFK